MWDRVSWSKVVVWVAFLLVVVGCPGSNGEDAPRNSGGEEDSGLWDEVEHLYGQARDTGEQVPGDVYDWLKEDLNQIGDWEYRVVEIPSSERTLAETELNDLGKERWECFWVEARGSRTRFYLKRPSRSYLRNLPLSDLMKVVPTPDAGGGGE
jgi:hypothetical protein